MSPVMQPRRALSRAEWVRMASASAPPVLALWADPSEVYALLGDRTAPLLVSTAVEDGSYPALSPVHPKAARFERMVHDLWGHVAVGAVDQRPWLDHGRWPSGAPMAPRPGSDGRTEQAEFLLAEDLDQVPLGPVRGGIEPAAHVRLGVRGETIVRLETRLGYTHKGTLSLMRGKSPRAAARFAARLAGEATVAHSIAFARATEAALGCEVPPRALALRQVMAGIERIAGNLDCLAAIAESLGRQVLAVRPAWHAEMMRRAADAACGHRLMMDCVLPGGVAADLASGGVEAIGQAVSGLLAELPDLRPHWGDVLDAKASARLRAVADGVALVNGTLGVLPDGAISAPVPTASGEGIGFADGPNGEIWHWLQLDHGQIAGAFMLDPAWSHWAELEATMAGGRIDDLPLAIASLGLSSSGADL